MLAAGVLAAFGLLPTPPSSSLREGAESCGRLVECGNGTLSVPKAKVLTKGCPGTPPCSAHGKCHETKSASGSAFSCKCEGGYFGKDCAHMKHDCVKQTTCAVCQDPANAKFCGWCADGRYCVPKHVHSALMQDGQGAGKRSCASWHEDSCPAPKRVPRPGNATPGDDGFMDLESGEEWGDERSVALAEALVEIIDRAGGRGTSGRLGLLLFLLFGTPPPHRPPPHRPPRHARHARHTRHTRHARHTRHTRHRPRVQCRSLRAHAIARGSCVTVMVT